MTTSNPKFAHLKPGDEVAVVSRWRAPVITKVRDVAPGRVVVDGRQFDATGRQLGRDHVHPAHLEPVADAHRAAAQWERVRFLWRTVERVGPTLPLDALADLADRLAAVIAADYAREAPGAPRTTPDAPDAQSIHPAAPNALEAR